MGLIELLENESVDYKCLSHNPIYCAQKMAQVEHVKGHYIAKPVVIKADNAFYMCVVPGCCKIDLDTLTSLLGAEEARLATEQELAGIFPDCEIGAEPPFGSLYDLSTLMDKRLMDDEFIIFQSGSHEKAIKITMEDYLKLESPTTLSFSYHL